MTKSDRLTPKQQMIFDFIQNYVEENHMPPSLREIGFHFDLSVGTVQDQVNAIRRKGFLEKQETKARGLRVPIVPQKIPIVGRIHAGPLHAALEDVEGYLPTGTELSASRHFALRVRGDSMMNAGILDGDMVIVRIQSTAQDGDIVVARVEDEATVKRLKRNEKKTVLEPANPAYECIQDVPFSLVGIVVEVRRNYK